MLLFLDLCLELKGSDVGRKRRNQSKNKVKKKKAVYCSGVDNAFLEVSAVPSLQAVLAGTVCFHTQEVNICIPNRLPNVLLCARTVFAHAGHSTVRQTDSPFHYTSSKEHLHRKCKRQVKFLRSFVSLGATPRCLLLPWPCTYGRCREPHRLFSKDCGTQYLCVHVHAVPRTIPESKALSVSIYLPTSTTGCPMKP